VVVSLRGVHVLGLLAGLIGLLALGVPFVGSRLASGASRPDAAVLAATTAGDRALRLVTYDVNSLGYRLSFRPARNDLRGQIDPDAHTITVFVSLHDAPHRVAHDIAHELGHAYDARFMSPAQRAHYLAVRLRPTVPWWPGTRAADYVAGAVTDYASGAGDFAEVFALCHAPSPEFRSTMAARPDDPCGLIPNVTRRPSDGRASVARRAHDKRRRGGALRTPCS